MLHHPREIKVPCKYGPGLRAWDTGKDPPDTQGSKALIAYHGGCRDSTRPWSILSRICIRPRLITVSLV